MNDTAHTQAIAKVSGITELMDLLGFDFDRLAELREESKIPRYVAGFNTPGYLPVSELSEFDDVEDAKNYIIHEIKHTEEYSDSEELAESLAAFAEDVNLCSGEFSAAGPEGLVYWVTSAGFMPMDADDATELAELEAQVGEYEDADGVHAAIMEYPLSAETRSGWVSYGEDMTPAEYRIVLCTGGPHVELVGDLGYHGEPDSVRVLYSDWGTSGELFEFDHSAVLSFCQYFFN